MLVFSILAILPAKNGRHEVPRDSPIHLKEGITRVPHHPIDLSPA